MGESAPFFPVSLPHGTIRSTAMGIGTNRPTSSRKLAWKYWQLADPRTNGNDRADVSLRRPLRLSSSHPGFTRACCASSLRSDRGSQWTPSSGTARDTGLGAVRSSPLDSVHFESQGKALYRASRSGVTHRSTMRTGFGSPHCASLSRAAAQDVSPPACGGRGLVPTLGTRLRPFEPWGRWSWSSRCSRGRRSDSSGLQGRRVGWGCVFGQSVPHSRSTRRRFGRP
jgi:hypothetical protein